MTLNKSLVMKIGISRTWSEPKFISSQSWFIYGSADGMYRFLTSD